MANKKDEDPSDFEFDDQINIKLPSQWTAKIDAEIKRRQRANPAVKVTRADVARTWILRGLETLSDVLV